jgi:hypothetical protein
VKGKKRRSSRLASSSVKKAKSTKTKKRGPGRPRKHPKKDEAKHPKKDEDDDDEYIPPSEEVASLPSISEPPKRSRGRPPSSQKNTQDTDDEDMENEDIPPKKKRAPKCPLPTNWKESNATNDSSNHGRIAGSAPTSEMQQFDRPVRNRMLATRTQFEKLWGMCTSSVKYGHPEFNAGMPRAEKKKREAWANVIFAPCLYTEMKPNGNGVKNAVLLDTPEMHFTCPTEEAANILLNSIMSQTDNTGEDLVNIVVHTNYDSFQDFIIPELRTSREKAAAKKAAEEAAKKSKDTNNDEEEN